MALTVRQVRGNIAAAITSALGAGGWKESRTNYDLFPQDARDTAHKSFAVGVPSSAPAALDRQNNRGGTTERGAVTTTVAGVRFCFRLRADAQVADYDDALTAEAALIAAVLELEAQAGMSIRLLRVPLRTGAAGDGTAFLGQLDFEILHRMPLE